MTVYVDDAFIRARVGRISGRWSHLFADTEEELHAFAEQIGLRRSWYQRPKPFGVQREVVASSLRAQMWHYDVTESRRTDALRAGALPVTTREGNRIIRARHARLFPADALPASSPPILAPPDHVWPDLPDDFEKRQGGRWCRRCGRLLWRAKDGARPDVPECQVVRVEFRGDDDGRAFAAAAREAALDAQPPIGGLRP